MGFFINLALSALPLAVAGGVLCFLIRRARFRRRGLTPSRSREVWMALFVCYLVGLWQLVLLPSNLMMDLRYFLRYHDTLYSDGFAHYLPVLDPSRWSWSFDLRGILGSQEAISNLLLFLPMGFFLPLLWPRLRWKTLLIGFCTSLAVEVLQMPIGRAFDLRDLVMNTAGTAVGMLLFRLYRYLSSTKPSSVSR